jgi:hypothetical protein
MDRQYHPDGFNRQNQLRLDHKIEAQAVVNDHTTIHDRQTRLPLELQSPFGQLVVQTRFVDTLEQPRTKRPMCLKSGSQNAVSKVT